MWNLIHRSAVMTQAEHVRKEECAAAKAATKVAGICSVSAGHTITAGAAYCTHLAMIGVVGITASLSPDEDR